MLHLERWQEKEGGLKCLRRQFDEMFQSQLMFNCLIWNVWVWGKRGVKMLIDVLLFKL